MIKEVFNHYWRFVRKRIFSQIVVLLGYGISVICTTAIVPLIYKEIIDTVSLGRGSAEERLGELLIFLALIIIIYNIFFKLADYILITSQSKIIKELYDYSLEKLQKHSYDFFTNAFVGGIVAKTKRFVFAFEILHDHVIFQIWMNGVALIATLIVLWLESWILGLTFLVWLLLYSVLVRFMVKWQIPKSLESAKAETKTNSYYADLITNILTVKMFSSSKREQKKFYDITRSEEKKRTAAWLQQNFWNGLFQSITIAIFNIVILWFVIDLWKKGIVPAGTIALVQIYVVSSFNIVWNISRNIIRSSAALSDAVEMVKILSQEVGVRDSKNPEKADFKNGEISFENVSFCYKDGEKVFENLNLKIKSGEKIALVGHSGAGKTTLVKLLLRFLDINGGSIKIDEQDITKITQDDLRSKIAYVPQEPLLFHRTIKENIAYSKPEADFSNIVDVAKKAQAHEFIERLKDGYDSLVGERGVKLSGGERQRISIARAMLKNSPIVVLDEATSSLDSISEEKIQKALLHLTKNVTTIVIAHRLSTIKKMDKIIVFDKGKIVEIGTHEDLLKKRGFYASFWESQVGGFSS